MKMKKYLVDSNVFVRYLINDEPLQYRDAEKFFSSARNETIKMFVLSEVILEVEYVLRKVYKISRKDISEKLLSILKMKYLHIEKQESLISSLKFYVKSNVDLVDALVYVESRKRDLIVLSFDNDFKKIK